MQASKILSQEELVKNVMKDGEKNNNDEEEKLVISDSKLTDIRGYIHSIITYAENSSNLEALAYYEHFR